MLFEANTGMTRAWNHEWLQLFSQETSQFPCCVFLPKKTAWVPGIFLGFAMVIYISFIKDLVFKVQKTTSVVKSATYCQKPAVNTWVGKQMQFCVRFITLWQQNRAFKDSKDVRFYIGLCSDSHLLSKILGND